MHQQPGPHASPGPQVYGPAVPRRHPPRRRGAIRSAAAVLPLALLVACEPADTGERSAVRTDLITRATATAPGGTGGRTATASRGSARTYRGTGSKVLELRKSDRREIWLVTLTHDGRSNFVVTPLASGGGPRASIVNEIGRYQGTVLLNERTGDETAALRVEADGAWTVTLKPLSMARVWSGGRVTGRGDDVLALVPSNKGLTVVEMRHSGRANFIVQAYRAGDVEYLVNEIGTWRGEVPLPKGTILITVDADGDWTFRKLG